MVLEVVVGAVVLGWSLAGANYPQFDANTQMRNLLLPADARVGSVIYRLRGTDSDRDYPLHFAATDYGSYVVRLENFPCNKSSPACEANVYLERSVSPGQVFKFRLTVRDSVGDTTTSAAAIKVSDGTTDFQNVFPHVPGVIMIPEDTKVGTELEYVIVRKHPRSLRPAKLELVGADEFTIQQTSKKDTTTGLIMLSLPLDYEIKTMYKLSVYATGMWTETNVDTRNVAGFELVVVVTDVQDTPPVWDAIAPITNLSPNLTKGDVVMKVTARDGDRGSPREVRYALAAEKNPFTVFFNVDEITGEIRLVRELKELTAISRSHQPILLTVIAEEVDPEGNPGDSSTATVALLLGELGNTPPYFESTSYASHLPENSPQGTALVFGEPYITTVKDNDMGKHGVFSLSLENNNGTFEITPTVGEREADFIIRVRDNSLLDYEARTEVSFKIWAKELSPVEKPLSSSVDVVIYIKDANDNPPVFVSNNYTAEAPENFTVGYRLAKVEATDVDTGDGGIIKYTAILGVKNSSLTLHPDTGVISVATEAHGFDREESSIYHFYVEAADNKGFGNRASVPFTLYVLDVNDNVPRFVKNPMDFILGAEGRNFSQRAFIKAEDDDAEAPNNVVRYEILSGNYGNRFLVDAETGELQVNPDAGRVARQTTTLVATLLVRAYDLGIPSLWTTGEVRVFPAESQARTMKFLLPGQNLDPKKVEATLSQISGASRVIIHNIQPYNGQRLPGDSTDLSSGPGGDKSIVTATILYSNNAVVDLEELQKKFATSKNVSSVIINERIVSNATESSEARVIFWIMVVLLLLFLLALLILLLCCLCPCCPYYAYISSVVRRKGWLRDSTVVAAGAVTDKEKPPEKENKSVQAEWLSAKARREAWSADDSRGWAFNGISNSPRRLFLIPRRYHQQQQRDRVFIQQQNQQQPQQQPQPNVIFTREVSTRPLLLQSSVSSIQMPEKPRPSRQEALLLEDIEGTEYQVLDPARLREAPTRQSMFIRDGGAEILRLVTRGRSGDEEEPRLNQPQRPYTLEQRETDGKASIMKRFINDTNGNQAVSKEEEISRLTETEQRKTDVGDDGTSVLEESRREDLMKRVMDLDVDKDMSTADVNRLTTIQRDLLLTRFLVEEQRRAKVDDTQSLPGVVTMATQTDQHAGTQTDKAYFKRRSKSDNDDSASDTEENGKKRFRRKKIRAGGTIEFRPASRCEIKSPIFEECEESKSQGVSLTKTSLVRQSAVRSNIDEEVSKQNNTELDLTASRRKELIRSLHVTPVKQLNIINNVLVEHITHREASSQSSIDPADSNPSRSKSSLEPPNARSTSRLDIEKLTIRSRGGVRTHPTSRETSISPSKDPHYRSLSHGRISPRYMDWYKTKKEQREKQKRDEKDVKFSQKQIREESSKLHPKKFNPYLRKHYGRRERQKGFESPSEEKGDIIQDKQQSKKEENFIIGKDKQEEDLDSGIALPYHIGRSNMKNHHALEKKSIFTIAYDDMQTKQLRLDSASSP